MIKNKKSITEQEMLAILQGGKLEFPPLQVTDVQLQPRLVGKGGLAQPDALIGLRWEQKAYRFALAAKRLWTPKVFAIAVDQARRAADLAGAFPLILLPYLSSDSLLSLQAQRVSGLDLCGNGVVIIPDEFLVLRTGFPNQFPWEGAIKNVYRKNSSVVARAFLLVPQFDSVMAALEEIRRRGGEITNSTVSKVCKSMEDDLVIQRSRGEVPVALRLRLLQPEKLLDLLTESYVQPEVIRTFRGKTRLSSEVFRGRLEKLDADGVVRIILTGASSVGAYAVMAREQVQSFYCTDIDKVVAILDGDIRETDRFENVILKETQDDFVYFDRRPPMVASPIQSYLELAAGDNREKETAAEVRRAILTELARASRWGQ